MPKGLSVSTKWRVCLKGSKGCYVRVCIMSKKCLYFRKFGMLCFLETPVLKFALLPYELPKNSLYEFSHAQVILSHFSITPPHFTTHFSSPLSAATSPFLWLLDSRKIIQCFTPNLYTLPHPLPPPDVIWHWRMLKYIESKYNKQVLHCIYLVEISVDFSPCSNLTQFLLKSKL